MQTTELTCVEGIIGVADTSPVVPPEYEMLARQPGADLRGIAIQGSF